VIDRGARPGKGEIGPHHDPVRPGLGGQMPQRLRGEYERIGKTKALFKLRVDTNQPVMPAASGFDARIPLRYLPLVGSIVMLLHDEP
jgi:hypothetical protein